MIRTIFDKIPTLKYMINAINVGHNKQNFISIKNLLIENQENILNSPGSLSSHQNWPGGFLDHVLAMEKTANILWIHGTHKPFTLRDLYLVILLHDIEKPFKYSNDEQWKNKTNKQIVNEIIEKYKFDLNETHLNALKYAHGENEDYVPHQRVMNELAAYLHSCDVISARADYDLRIFTKNKK